MIDGPEEVACAHVPAREEAKRLVRHRVQVHVAAHRPHERSPVSGVHQAHRQRRRATGGGDGDRLERVRRRGVGDGHLEPEGQADVQVEPHRRAREAPPAAVVVAVHEPRPDEVLAAASRGGSDGVAVAAAGREAPQAKARPVQRQVFVFR